MISRSGIGEIQPANCQMTAADVAAIAMIRKHNKSVGIHGLIKHCIWSWTDEFGHFYACVREMTGQGTPAPRKHVNNFRCDLFRDACKTTRSGAMNTERITIPRSKLRKYCHSWLFMHDRVNQSEVGSTVYNFQNGGRWEPCGRYRVSPTQTKIFLNLNRKESMKNIDIHVLIFYAISLRTVMILLTRLGSNTVICQSRLC